MTDSLAGVVLAAGGGQRLRPLTRRRPKVLCPVGGVPLVDHAIARFDGVTEAIAVNVHHGRDQLERHLAGRVHLSVEEPVALGTAGAIGRLRGWIDGRPTLVVNGDTWVPVGLGSLVDGWDGERIRLLVVGGGPLTPTSVVAGALLPWAAVAALGEEPAGLYEASWRDAAAAGRVEAVDHTGPCHDCGTPARYLAANLEASGGASVVGVSATVGAGATLVRCVVWDGATVYPGERLVDAIRADDHMTVLVR